MRVDRLKSIREMRGFTQQELAERSGISLRQVLRYESGESDPAADALTRIAKTGYSEKLVDFPFHSIFLSRKGG